MGDRGGTATTFSLAVSTRHYTRWEIGGEPQRPGGHFRWGVYYTRWEIGGGTATMYVTLQSESNYTRWEIGGEPQLWV